MLTLLKFTSDADQYALSQVVEGNPVATLVIDANHQVTHWNKACAQLTGISAQEMIGRSEQWRAFYPNQRPIMADLIVDGALDGEVEAFYLGKFRSSKIIDGAFEAEDFFPNFGESGRWLFFTAAAIRNKDGEIIGAIETLQDITERKIAEALVQEREAFLAQIVDGSSVATLVIDSEHRITHWNRACEIMTSVAARDMIGTNRQWHPFYGKERPIMADLVLDGARESGVDALYHGKFRPSALIEGAYEAEDFFPGFGISGKWLFFTAAPLRDASGHVIGAIETLQDVTERRVAENALKENEERYRLLSVTDALTGLFNSRHFYEQLQGEVERAGRYHRPLSLMIIDADNFKRINDTYGHLQGDRVLQTLASVMRHVLRCTDSAYRYGGEEFSILMPEAELEAARVVAERLRKVFVDTPHHPADNVTMHCSVSIGVAQYVPGESSQSLIKRADDAAYEAKRRGKNCVVTTPLSDGL